MKYGDKSMSWAFNFIYIGLAIYLGKIRNII